MWLRSVNLFSNFYWFKNLIEREIIALVSLKTHIILDSGLLKFKETVSFLTQIKAGFMVSICLIFQQK